MNKFSRKEKRIIRHARVRSQIKGTSDRPRLSVFRSNNNLYAQIIDDQKGHTLCGVSSISFKEENLSGVPQAEKIGEMIAKAAQEKGVKNVVFDRGGYLYHGRIKALAESARKNGLVF